MKKVNLDLKFVIFTLTLMFALSNSVYALSVENFNPNPIKLVFGTKTFSFSLVEDQGLNITNIISECILPFSGSCTITCPSELWANETSGCMGTLNVPQYTYAGNYRGSINISGDANGSIINASYNFNITITEQHGLEINYALDDMFTDDSQNVQVEFKNTGNIDLMINANVSIEDKNNNLVNKSKINANLNETGFILAPGTSKVVELIIETQNANTGRYNAIINAVAENPSWNISFNTQKKNIFNVLFNYCGGESKSNYLNIEIKNKGDFEGENFEPLDSFDIEVRVDNDDNDKHDVVVKAALVKDNEIITDSEISEYINVDENGRKTLTLSIEVPIIDGDRYDVYVKAYDDDNEAECVQDNSYIDVERPTRKVKIKKLVLDKENYTCGSRMFISGTVVNIGLHDEDLVKLVYSDDIGNDIETEFSLNQDDEKNFIFQPRIPENYTEGQHTFNLKVYYDYDSDTSSFDRTNTYYYNFNVQGGCVKPEKNASIVVSLNNIMAINNKYTGQIIITNTGQIETTYEISVNADWANISIDKSLITLNPNEQGTIYLEITPIETGQKTITITVRFDNKEVVKHKTVKVEMPIVEPKTKKAGWLDEVIFEFERSPWAFVIVTVSLIIALASLIGIIILVATRK